MISATKARKITEENRCKTKEEQEKFLSFIEESIIESAKQRFAYMTMNFIIDSSVKNELSDLGYYVESRVGGDTKISW